MAYRYRVRKVDDDLGPWSDPMRLRKVMLRVKRRQASLGGPYRLRRRSEEWRTWWKNALRFRARLRFRLSRSGPRVVWQAQYAGEGGPIDAILKFQPPNPALAIGERVLEEAKSCVGIPYGFGDANGPDDPGTDSLDCSGFTQYTWGTVGVFLPHAARLQQVAGNVDVFTDERDCVPGDLVLQWFENSRGIPRGTASHVGHWLRAGWEIDTRSPSKPVAIRPIEPDSVICYGRPRASQQL